MKRRLVVAFVVAFAIWPALQRVLVQVYDVNPWKMAGWAMYAWPHLPPRIELRLVEGGREVPVAELDAWEQTLAAEFIERRDSVGRLASPDSLAAELLAKNTRAEAVVVEVSDRFFDLPSATIQRRVERRTYRRQGAGQ